MGHSSLTLGQAIYLITAMISFIITGFFAWYVRRKLYNNPGEPEGLWLLIVITLFSLSHSLSMIGPSKNLAYFLFNLRFLFLAAIPVLWLIFVLLYVGKQKIITRKFILAIILIPAITQIFIWTNDAHNLWVIKDIIILIVSRLKVDPKNSNDIIKICIGAFIIIISSLFPTFNLFPAGRYRPSLAGL